MWFYTVWHFINKPVKTCPRPVKPGPDLGVGKCLLWLIPWMDPYEFWYVYSLYIPLYDAIFVWTSNVFSFCQKMFKVD